jgi:DNA-binding transcriptional MerR regulator
MARRTKRARRRAAPGGRVTLITRTVLCTLGEVSEGQLSVWEQEELIAPARVEELRGRREPLYDADALRRVRLIRTLGEELEVNLPGISVILHLLEQLSG